MKNRPIFLQIHHTYSSSGRFKVKLVATNTDGAASASLVILVEGT